MRLALDLGWNSLASQLLEGLALLADGAAPPADLITGTAIAELQQRIDAVRAALQST